MIKENMKKFSCRTNGWRR